MNPFSDLSVLASSSSGGNDVIAIVAIVFGCGFLIVKTITKAIVDANVRKHERELGATGATGAKRAPGGSDVTAIRQMQQTLTKMEERVEALETILIEHTRSQKL